MMRLIPSGPAALVCALGVASCAYAIAAAFSLTGRAGQLRSVTDGVYRAGRRRAASRSTRSNARSVTARRWKAPADRRWSERASSRTGARVRWRISSTRFRRRCPSTCRRACPGSNPPTSRLTCSRPASFPPDQAELTDAMLAQIALPTARTVRRARAPRSPAALSSPAGRKPGRADESHRVSQLEHHLQPAAQGSRRPSRRKQPAASPFDYVEWGSTVYPRMAGCRSGGRGAHRDRARCS